MSIKYLGSPFDMHGGGKDLVFPHHENERAQAECATGRKFVNYWVHNGFVTMEREKMSKSLGNFMLIKDFLTLHHAEVLRLFFLSAHYRNPVDYAQKAIESAESALGRLYATLERVAEVKGIEKTAPAGNDEIDGIVKRFHEAMEDDFNTAVAVSTLFDLSTVINRMLDEGKKAPVPEVLYGRNSLLSLAELLGLLRDDVEAYLRQESERHLSETGLDEKDVEAAIAARADARKNRDFVQADEIRNGLLEKGILLLDTPQGTKWRVKKG